MHVQPFLQQRDERQEPVPLQPVLVQVLGHAVRRRHDRDAVFKQQPEQTPDDHRIGDVGHLHLVKTQQARVLGDLFGDGFQRIRRARLAHVVQTGVDVLHERMEMHATLFGDGHVFEKEIHQHGFTAPDPAPKVQTLDRCGLFAKQAKAALFPCGLFNRAAHGFQRLQHRQLARIGMDFAGLNPTVVFFAQRIVHAIHLRRAWRQEKGPHEISMRAQHFYGTS